MEHQPSDRAAAERSTVDVGLAPAATNDTSGLFVPETLLPTQHQSHHVPDSPYRSLVRAVLERALLDAAAGPARADERDEALDWFRHTGDEPFSFNWIGAHLGFDPGWMRERILARFGETVVVTESREPEERPAVRISPMPRRRAA